MRYIISGGGTGGHIYPALAILDQIKKIDTDAKILYVGTPDGLERELAIKSGYDYETVRVMGLPRKPSLKSLKSAAVLLKGLGDANRILRKFKPDVVIGTGGYVSFPVVFLAQKKKIKTMIQEQNAYPGKVNRILAKEADKVAIAFEDAKKRLDTSKIFLAGNPIRPDFLNINREESRKNLRINKEEKVIVSFGGSGGQESINDAVIGMLKENNTFPYTLYHITGRVYYKEFMDKIKAEKIQLADNINIIEYSHKMPELLGGADLGILSSSAMSLAEISALGLPSILIPKEYTADNHQEFNARAFENAGASSVILEKDLNSNTLYESIKNILDNESLMLKMKECAKILARPNSTKEIVENIFELIKWFMARKRKKKNYKILKIIPVLILLALLVFVFIRLPMFKIIQISIVGLDRIEEEEVVKVSKLKSGDNFFFIDKEEIKNNIQKLPLVEDVIIRRDFPNSINIEIKERKAAASVQFSNKYILVDKFGYILGENENLITTLTQINGILNKEKLIVGTQIQNYLPENTREFFSIVLNGENIFRYKSINTRDDKVDLVLKDETKVAFGSYDNSEYKFKVIDQMLSSVEKDSSRKANMILMEEGPNPILVYE